MTTKSSDAPACTFERRTDLDLEDPDLIVGLPGLGLVASIALSQVERQRDLDLHGSLRSEGLPPVTAFEAGETLDPVRVYSGSDPAMLTVQSSVSVPDGTARSLAGCVADDLSTGCERTIVLAGAPASSEEERGEVYGIATTESQRDEIEDAGIELAEGRGSITGAPGALVSTCHRRGLPAIALLVKAQPQIPDPTAAQSAIEDGLEQLLGVEIDTDPLEEEAEEISRKKQQIAQQLGAADGPGEGEGLGRPSSIPSLYQ